MNGTENAMNAGSTTPSQSGSDLSLVKERKIGSYPAKANRLTTAALSDIFLPHGVRRCAGAALRERGVARAWRYAGRGVARGAAIRGRGETRVRRYAGAALRGRGDTRARRCAGAAIHGARRYTGAAFEGNRGKPVSGLKLTGAIPAGAISPEAILQSVRKASAFDFAPCAFPVNKIVTERIGFKDLDIAAAKTSDPCFASFGACRRYPIDYLILMTKANVIPSGKVSYNEQNIRQVYHSFVFHVGVVNIYINLPVRNITDHAGNILETDFPSPSASPGVKPSVQNARGENSAKLIGPSPPQSYL